MTIADNIAFGLKIKREIKAYIKDKSLCFKTCQFGRFLKIPVTGLIKRRTTTAYSHCAGDRKWTQSAPFRRTARSSWSEASPRYVQYELIRLKNELGITFVYVTHDQEEALTMSDRWSLLWIKAISNRSVRRRTFTMNRKMLLSQILSVTVIFCLLRW